MNSQTKNIIAVSSKDLDKKLRLIKSINKIQNDSVKYYLLPGSSLPESQKYLKYLNETEMLNRIVFGCSSKVWKRQNFELTMQGLTIRSAATMERLQLLFILVIDNLFYLIEELPRDIRVKRLSMTAAQYSIPANHILG